MTGPSSRSAGILPSWRDGATRTSLLAFLDQVGQIPPAERVAVFDNDGTMWGEKPRYTQLEFLVRELRAAAADDPALHEHEVYGAILDGDRAALGEMGLTKVAMALVELHEGLTPDDFGARVRSFFAHARHPDRGTPFGQLRYQPMLELIDELRTRGFDVYLVSAGGADFVRVISEDFYGVKPEGVVGSQIRYRLDRSDNGSIGLVRTADLVGSGPNEGPAKPPNIQRILGRRPCVAGGNSAGDAEMLQYAAGYDGPSLALLVDHDDEEREYAYASEAGTFDTDETILETAVRFGWVVASMKHDWTTVYAVP